ncbi:MAG: FAD-binding oxidoreductase [Motiliproteus sp.]|nr:FAD-binding oxidoreductase [Motiliproteus sp.]MCW9053453.1 FAD-binding oxidoreductase [Motiliproteus sp.]
MSNDCSVRIQGSDIEFVCDAGETILDAALRQGFNLPHSCQSGSCGQCAAVILDGAAKDDEGIQETGEEILSCCSYATTDLLLKTAVVSELQGVKVKTLPAKVDGIERVANDVLILTLRFPPKEAFTFLPGQFIDLLFQGVRRSYSIANACAESKKIELHIRAVKDGLFTEHAFSHLKQNDLLRFEGPLGTFFVRQGQRPIIFLAGGTGFAPVKSMVESLITEQDRRDIYIYWGADIPESLYSSLAGEWQRDHSNVNYIPVISGQVDGDDWGGRRGLAHQAVLEDFPSLSGFDVYACGSPAMIDAARNDFQTAGLSIDRFYADAFIASS